MIRRILLSLIVTGLLALGAGLGWTSVRRDIEAAYAAGAQAGLTIGANQAYQQGYYDAMQNAPFWYQL